MIDPISAVAMATSAFSMVKKLVNAGREIEDVMGQLGKWYTAVADISRAEQQRKNPPLFKKLFNGKSIEQEALEILVHKKKLAEQERELQTMLNFAYGPSTWQELIELRRKVRKQREDTLYRQQELRQNIVDNMLIVVMLILFCGIVGGTIYGIGVYRGIF